MGKNLNLAFKAFGHLDNLSQGIANEGDAPKWEHWKRKLKRGSKGLSSLIFIEEWNEVPWFFLELPKLGPWALSRILSTSTETQKTPLLCTKRGEINTWANAGRCLAFITVKAKQPSPVGFPNSQKQNISKHVKVRSPWCGLSGEIFVLELALWFWGFFQGLNNDAKSDEN